MSLNQQIETIRIHRMMCRCHSGLFYISKDGRYLRKNGYANAFIDKNCYCNSKRHAIQIAKKFFPKNKITFT